MSAMQTVSIGYTRDDGDFRILATLSNIDEEITKADFAAIVADVTERLQNAMRDDLGEIPELEILERQDAPDYATLDGE